MTTPLTTLTPAQREAVRALIAYAYFTGTGALNQNDEKRWRELGHVHALALLPEPVVRVPREMIMPEWEYSRLWDGETLLYAINGQLLLDTTLFAGKWILMLAAIHNCYDELPADDPRAIRWTRYLETKQ